LGILKRSVSSTNLLMKITEAKNEEPQHLVSDLVYQFKHFPITNKAPRSYFLVGIVEVKVKDFLQDIAQNAVQYSDGKAIIRLSNHLVVVYEDDDMEGQNQ
ncbi:4014_t:CDS:2, partial [Gigaspora rosea]